MFVTLVVLNDGETYSGINGCKIIVVSEEDADSLFSSNKIEDLNPVVTIPLESFVAEEMEPIDEE